ELPPKSTLAKERLNQTINLYENYAQGIQTALTATQKDDWNGALNQHNTAWKQFVQGQEQMTRFDLKSAQEKIFADKNQLSQDKESAQTIQAAAKFLKLPTTLPGKSWVAQAAPLFNLGELQSQVVDSLTSMYTDKRFINGPEQKQIQADI